MGEVRSKLRVFALVANTPSLQPPQSLACGSLLAVSSATPSTVGDVTPNPLTPASCSLTNLEKITIFVYFLVFTSQWRRNKLFL